MRAEKKKAILIFLTSNIVLPLKIQGRNNNRLQDFIVVIIQQVWMGLAICLDVDDIMPCSKYIINFSNWSCSSRC